MIDLHPLRPRARRYGAVRHRPRHRLLHVDGAADTPPAIVAHVAGTVVVADTIFTATAVVVQPVTGVLLAQPLGWPLSEDWIVLSLLLYVVTGLFWLPVVFDPDPPPQPRPSSSRDETRRCRSLFPPLPHLVPLRLPGFPCRARSFSG